MSADQSHAQFTVIKRDGRVEPYIAEKAIATLLKFCYGINADALDLRRIVRNVTCGIAVEMSTVDIQRELSLAAANLASHHPNYALLAGRLEVAQLHRSTQKQFSDYILWMAQVEPSIFAPDFVDVVEHLGFEFDHALRHARDYDLRFLSIKSLEKTYLVHYNGVTVERPQWMYMRVAVALHGKDVRRVLETYDLLSRGFYTHATPTLANAGRRRQSLSSCFIVPADCNSPTTTYNGLRDIANIFIADGGVGLDLHRVPAKRSDRPQAGVIPYLRVVDATVRLTSQYKSTRPSALTATIPVWHADVFDFINLKSTRGQQDMRARDVFTAIIIPDLFMQRVMDNGVWHVYDPRDVPELLECYGAQFEAVYARLEETDRALATVPARTIWDLIVDAQIETGGTFMLYLDAINKKSNQQNIGTIQSANLCTEIVQHISSESTAVCTLSSIVLPSFVTPTGDFDFDALHRIAQIVVRNTDRVLDISNYPTPQAKHSADTTRAIGVGVQGLADVFMRMHIPYDSDDAVELNRSIFETIYHAALEASCDLARQHGPYPAWEGSPAYHLQLQFDLWGVQPSTRYDWADLKNRIHVYGLRNSMLTAQMPTAATSQIAGVIDGTEPCISNLYNRRTLSGEFQLLNPWLVRDLVAHHIWGDGMRDAIVRANGSIQDIPDVPCELKDIYKTAWEIPQKRVVDMAAARGPYICQSQSMTIYMADPTHAKLTSMHFHGWRSGLKTGMYYLRSQPPVFPDRIGVTPAVVTPPLIVVLPDGEADAGTASAPSPPTIHDDDYMKLTPLDKDYHPVAGLDVVAVDPDLTCTACSG